MVDQTVDWIKESQTPAFVHFLNIITHHPYGAPEGFVSPFSSSTSLDRYKTAILYTDTMLQRMVAQLRQVGLDRNTMLAIVGDHGEAFGTLHANNFAHKNYVYEENIRNYLMLIDLSKEITPVYSKKRGFVGDVMPTILDAQNLDPDPSILGKSLFSGAYEERMVFFHKNTTPEEWGLQDGNWKFMEERIGNANPELYNLDNDPDEQVNLASSHPERVADYTARIANWFIYSNQLFVSRLDGYNPLGKQGLSVAESITPGPKRITVGRKQKDMPFVPIEGSINPDETLTVWTNGVAYPTNTRVDYVFTSPSGKTESTWLEYNSDWSTVYLLDPTNQPREEGNWKVDLFQAGKLLISTDFTVSRHAKLYWSFADKRPGFRDLVFGAKTNDNEFRPLKEVNPNENVVAYAHLVPFGSDKQVLYTWTSPEGERQSFYFTVKSDWDSVWVFRDGNTPMQEGVWKVELDVDGSNVIAGQFLVSKRSQLFQPVYFANSAAK